MKKSLWTLVGVSLAVNLWLLLRPEPPAEVFSLSGASRVADVASNASEPASTAASSTVNSAAAAAGPARIAAVLKELAAFDESDLPAARDRLRALGASESTVFAAMDGVFRLNYYRLVRNTEIENIRAGWWRGDPAGNRPGWGKHAEAPFFKLMGYDPHDLIDYGTRFDFLSPEKAGALARIAVDYYGLSLQVAEDPNYSAQAAQLTINERRADVMKLLTPEEVAEYDLRFSLFADLNVRRFAKMQATEKEFRAISPLVERVQEEVSTSTRDPAIPAAQRATVQRDIQQRGFDELVATVGYDRAVAYAWAGVNLTVGDPATSATVSISAVPNSARVLQLAAETGAQAAAIHNDTNLSLDGKRSALLTLQQAIQPKLDQLLPSAERANLDPKSFVWLDGLAKGEYVSLAPMLTPNRGGTTITLPVSVATPPRPANTYPQVREIK